MKIIILLINFLLLFFLFPQPIFSIYDPLEFPNNKFGIHIADLNDLEKAEELVNSAGGDWGYVTFVIRNDEQDLNQWQNIFKELENRHLIPIVRIATHLNGNYWLKPSADEPKIWAEFLDKLSWPTKNRYLVVYNEPNHTKEWGNGLNPSEYALILDETIKALKEKSNDFFILNAGFDLASPNGKSTMEPSLFWQKMDETVPGIFKKIDGWASHSYPNPGFSGSPLDKGKKSIQGYRWELEFLKDHFGVKDLPVFITETGWLHNAWQSKQGLTPEMVAKYYQEAFSQIWQDDQIVAITPFLLNYPNYPFAYFSWQVPGKDDFFPQFSTVQSLEKSFGFPKKEKFSGFGQIIAKRFEKKELFSYNNR